MGKYSPISLVVRCAFILAGMAVCGFGCGLFLTAGLGNDPVTVFVEGLGKAVGSTAGMGTNILNGVAFVILLIVNRRLIGIGTAICTLTLGFFIDLFTPLVGRVVDAAGPLWLRVAAMLVGTLGIAAGLGLYQGAELGVGTTDGINQTIVAKTGIPYRWERMLYDAVMLVGGWLLGGTIGLGTVVALLAIGPVMVPTIEWAKRRISAILSARPA